MPLLLKLVGQKKYQIKDSFEGPIQFKVLVDLFNFWGISYDNLEKIKFITDTEQMNINPDKSFMVRPDEDRIVYVFTSDKDVKNQLTDIFIDKGIEIDTNSPPQYDTSTQYQPYSSQNVNPVVPDSEITKPITIKEPEPAPKLTDEIIDMMNVKSVSLFSDPDFRNLISVYLRRPELFGTLAQYVQNGNIIEESLIPVKSIDELTDEELAHYKSLADKINHLELGVTNDIIINYLIKFSGHLNLTVRSLICDLAKESQ